MCSLLLLRAEISVDMMDPSLTVRRMHSAPRFFGPSEYSLGDSSAYVGNFVLTGAFVVSVGILIWLVLTCSIVKQSKKRFHRPKYWRIVGGLCWCIVALFGIAVTVAGAAFADKSLTSASSKLRFAQNVILDVKDSSSKAVTKGLDVLDGVKSLQDICGLSDIQSLGSISQIQGVYKTVSSVINGLNSFDLSNYDALVTGIEDSNDKMWRTSKTRLRGISSYAVLLTLILVSFMGFLLIPYSTAYLFRTGKILALTVAFSVIFSTLVVGLSLSFAIIASDFCISPERFVSSQFPSNHSVLFNYYSQCLGPNSDWLTMRSFITDIRSMERELDGLFNSVQGDIRCNHQRRESLLVNMRSNINVLESHILATRPALECNHLNGVYREIIYSSICKNMPEGFVQVMIGASIASLSSAGAVRFWIKSLSRRKRRVSDKGVER